MKIVYAKAVSKIKDKKLIAKISLVINNIKTVSSLNKLRATKKIIGASVGLLYKDRPLQIGFLL